MRALFVLGRAIFGGYFAWSGLNHFVRQREMSQYAAAKGVAAADTAVPASGAMILACSRMGVGGTQADRTSTPQVRTDILRHSLPSLNPGDK